MIQYQIVETMHLGKKTYVGRIKLKCCYDQNQLLERMVERNRSLSPETLVAALIVLKSTVTDLCREGNAVRLDGFVRFSPTMKGSFESHQDQFDIKRHTIELTAGVPKSTQLKINNRQATRKVESSNHAPQIFTVEDQETGTYNQVVTARGIVTLKGTRLRFDPTNLKESLVFQSSIDPCLQVAIQKPIIVSSKEVCFLMPEVPFAEGIFALTSTLGTTKPRTGVSQPTTMA